MRIFNILKILKAKEPTKELDPVVESLKSQTHAVAKEADNNAKKLNEMFEKNGITLSIHVAAGGRSSGH